MENKKCVVYNFAKGVREKKLKYSYNNGQLDLDLNIEVKSQESVYRTNILNFKYQKKVKVNDSSREELEEPLNIA